jgi:hypothetical protein
VDEDAELALGSALLLLDGDGAYAFVAPGAAAGAEGVEGGASAADVLAAGARGALLRIELRADVGSIVLRGAPVAAAPPAAAAGGIAAPRAAPLVLEGAAADINAALSRAI